MSSLKFLLVPILFVISFSTSAFSNQAIIYNFSSKKIFYAIKDPSQSGKIHPFKSQKIFLNNETAPLQIYTNSRKLHNNCLLEIHEKQDAFVHDDNKNISCTLRAERLPKEF